MWTNQRGYAWQRQLAELILAEDAEAEGFSLPIAHRLSPSTKPDMAGSPGLGGLEHLLTVQLYWFSG